MFASGYLLLSVGSVAHFTFTCLIVIGNGFFKPNISTMVGNFYPAGSPLRDSAYNIFYMGINVGAFLAPIVAEVLRQKFGFRAAFFAGGVGMALGRSSSASFTGTSARASKRSRSSDAQPMELAEDIMPVAEKTALEEVPEWKRIVALMVIFAIVIVFWMVFHQNGSTMTYWANDNTDWKPQALPRS